MYVCTVCYIPLHIGFPIVALVVVVVEAALIEVELYTSMVVEAIVVVVELCTPMVVVFTGEKVEAAIPVLIDTDVVTAVGKQR